MCLIVLSDHVIDGEARPAVADRNYIVYKRVRIAYDTLRSPVRGTLLPTGLLLRSDMDVQKQWVGYGPSRRYIVEAGWHSFRSRKYASTRFVNFELVPCIIPEGAKLYYGQDGEVVSDSLIIFNNRRHLNTWVNKQEKSSTCVSQS